MAIQINGTSGISGVDGSAATPALQGVDSNTGISFGTDEVSINTGGTTRAKVDSSGRLLVGTTSASADGRAVIQGRVGNALSFGSLFIQRGETGADLGAGGAGSDLGRIDFAGSDGATFGRITCTNDATTGSNDYPGRLVFSTCSDGSASPTERARITSGGFSKFTNNGSYRSSTGSSHELYSDSNSQILFVTATNGSFGSDGMLINVHRAANSGYNFFVTNSGNGADTEHYLRGDGQAYADGSWNGGGADYAEYFEWSDSNPDAEDRRGISVVLDGDKIREAAAGEDPIGVISGNPSVVGDAAWNKWNGKYLRDEFGTYIEEDYEVEDEDGNTVVQQRRKLNPAYDPDVEYINREDRPEWDCVGLMGKLRIRKGQITGSRWIKMRDISDSVEEWLVR